MRLVMMLALLVFVAHVHAAQFEWTAYGGDGRGQRYAPLSQITPQNVGNLELAWSFRTGELGEGFDRAKDALTFEATPLLIGDTLYVSTATGKVLSTYTARYIPAIDGATAFVQTATDGALQAVNITTGTMKWSFAGDGLLSGPPLVADGMVISQSHSGRIYVLAEASGSVLETLRTAAPVQVPNEAAAVSESGTAVGNGLYVAADIAGILYAYSN